MIGWISFWTLFKKESHRFLKVVIQTVFTPLVSSLLYLLVFGVTIGSRMEQQQGVHYLAFLIPGLCMMGLMNNAFQNSSSSVTIGKFTGEIEELKILPLSEIQIVMAMALASLLRGFIVASVTFAVSEVVYFYQFGEGLVFAHPFYLLFFIFMGGLIFGCLGISVAFWAKNFDQIAAISSFVLLPLTYLGGVFISIENFPPFWQKVSMLNPLLYLINGLRYGVLGVSDVPILTAVLVSLVSLVLFYILAYWSLKKASFTRW